MIAVDSSVVVAIARREADAAELTGVFDTATGAIMSVVSYVETNMVMAGRRSNAEAWSLDDLLAALHVDLVDVTAAQGRIAVEAFLRFGKGRHPARLNIADCFAYALAKSHNAPLFYKGDDFVQTDLLPAWRP